MVGDPQVGWQGTDETMPRGHRERKCECCAYWDGKLPEQGNDVNYVFNILVWLLLREQTMGGPSRKPGNSAVTRLAATHTRCAQEW